MKKKILFALAMPAILAACSNEEIVDMQSSEMKEVVGAELVSNGMTINFGGDVESRMTSAGQFDETDKLGLGWITTTGPSTTQDPNVNPDLNKLYGNHLFVKNGEADNAFTTYSNVYTGWHFAYYPYTRMPQVDQMKIDNVNPAMTKEYKYENGTKAEFMENRFHISAMDFITPADVDDNNALVGKKFDLIPMVSTFTVAAKVENDILNEADLKTLKITKLELNAGKSMLYSKAELNPQYLPKAVYSDVDPTATVQMEYDAAKTKAQMTVANLFAATDGKAIKKTGKDATLSTDVNVESYKLDGTKELRMNILPVDAADLYATSTPSAVVLKIYVEGGYFTVKYTPAKKDNSGQTIPYTTTESTNNTAITKVANLLSVAGHNEKNWSDLIGNEGVMVSLAKENFTADYTNIMNIGQWDGCVKVANALGADETPVFALGLNARVEFPAGTMNVPNKGVKVTSTTWGDNQLIFKEKTTWNPAISGCDNGTTIVVEKTGELTVNNAMWASRIVSKGTILAGRLASVGDAGSDRFDNSEGRVIVKYGAYIYPSSGKEGIIAYNVDGTESAAKINTLVATTGNKNGHAGVNTLIIANDVALNLNKTDEDDEDDDRYNGAVVDGSVLADMTNVAIEMNGGSIIAALNKVKKVHNVTIKGGVNTIKDVDVMGTLDVEAGSVTVDATEYTVEKIVNGDKVYEKVKNAADVNAITVAKGATLNVTVDTYTSDVKNNGAINVTDPYVLRYANSIEQSGSQSGKIVKGSIDLAAAIAAGGEITLMKDETLTEQLVVTNSVSINLNGKTLSYTNSSKVDDPALIIGGKGEVEIVNGKISSNGVGVQNQGVLVLDCDIESVSMVVQNAYNGKTTIEGGSYKNTQADRAAIYSDSYGSGKPELVINGGEFESTFTCVSYNNGSTGAVNGGTFTTSSEHCIYVGGSEGGCDVTYDATGCTFANNGQKATVYVGDMSGTNNKKNKVNGTEYTGSYDVLKK